MRHSGCIGAEHPQAADENGHLWRGQGEQLRLVDQQHFGGHLAIMLEVIAEPIGDGFERSEGIHIRLLLRGIHAAR